MLLVKADKTELAGSLTVEAVELANRASYDAVVAKLAGKERPAAG